jgi:dUTP pyrophosphatase
MGDINWADVNGDRGMTREPTQAYPDDAGFDLYVSSPRDIGPGRVVDIPCGVALELPSSVWVLLIGRSSTLRKRNLMVNPGIIDPGYRGELFVGVMNMGFEGVRVEAGERLAQAIFMPNLTFGVRLNRVDELAPHERGQNGFGSSGA